MQLTAQLRTHIGKNINSLRAKGFIPAELYGRGIQNLHLSVPAKDFSKVFRSAGESTVINLAVEGQTTPFSVLIHDLQEDSLRNEIRHVDFYAVRMDEKITISIPFSFIHEAPAVKEKNGVLVRAMHEVKVEALPGDLPHSLVVDLSSLADIGATIHLRDIALPSGVRALVDSESVVATITAQAAAEEVVVPVSVQDIKVEGEEKRAKEAVQKEAAAE